MPVGDSAVGITPGLHVSKSASQQSSDSSLQPSSSPHTGSSLGISSSLSPSLKKEESSQSEPLSYASPPSIDRNLSLSPHVEDTGVGVAEAADVAMQVSPVHSADLEVHSQLSPLSRHKKRAKDVDAKASQRVEPIASELLDSLFSNSNTEEFVDVEGEAKKEMCLTVATREATKDEDNSLTQLQETPDISPGSETRHRIPAFPLRSPAKISFEQECSSDTTNAMEDDDQSQEDNEGRGRDGKTLRSQTPLRLQLTQSQASQSFGEEELVRAAVEGRNREGSDNGDLTEDMETSGIRHSAPLDGLNSDECENSQKYQPGSGGIVEGVASIGDEASGDNRRHIEGIILVDKDRGDMRQGQHG